MQALFAAQKQLSECKHLEGVLETELVDLLERDGTGALRPRDEVAAVEASLEDVRMRIAESLAVVEYFQSRGEHASNTDLYRLVFHSRHQAVAVDPLTSSPPQWSEDEWMAHTMQWSESNTKRGITGLLMTTGAVHFGVLEGPHADVEAVYGRIAADKRHAHCTLLRIGKAEAREYLFGLKLHYVHDDIMATVLQRAQSDIIQSSAFAPQLAIDVVSRGGDPEGIVPDHRPESVAVAIVLDALMGANHGAVAYATAASTIDGIAAQHHGITAERFGECCVVVFPWSHATQAISVTKAILEAVPMAVAAVATGTCTFVSAPHCWAFGSALTDAKELVFVAERERRPLIVTTGAMERCSKAHHRFLNFTVDAHQYYTLQSIGDGRLGREQDGGEDDEMLRPPTVGMTAVNDPDVNVIQFRYMTHAELVRKRQGEAVVRGALTQERIKLYFRSLDPGNAGWVGKDVVSRWLNDGNGPYQLFEPHEAKQVATWLTKHNALGPKLLNYDEFADLCFMMERR